MGSDAVRKKRPAGTDRAGGRRQAKERALAAGRAASPAAGRTSSPAGAAAVGLAGSLGPAVPLAGGVQRKVEVGPANDAFEREADRVAQRVAAGQPAPRVSRMPATGTQGRAGLPEDLAQRRPAAPEEDEVRTAKSPATEEEKQAADLSAIASQAIESSGQGRPLDPGVRGRLESAFGEDLSHVRVHDGPADREAAAGIQARAFTHGSDVWLGPGESEQDITLMAHEVAHVLQQGAGPGAARRKLREGETAGIVQRSPRSAGPGTAAVQRGLRRDESLGVARRSSRENEMTGIVQRNPLGGGAGVVQRDPQDGGSQAQAQGREGGPRGDESTGLLEGDTITFSAIEVPKFKVSGHREERYARELKRSRNYSEESRQSARQRDVWQAELAKQTSETEEILRSKYERAYGSAPAGETYVFKAPSKKSKSEPVYFFGDLRTVAASLSLPSWDRAGRPHSFDVDHILELQLGNWPDDRSANDIRNMELLDSSVNRSSGSVIRNKIEAKVSAFIRATGGEFGSEPAAIKRSYHLRFRRAEPADIGKQPGRNDYWTREEIASGAHLGAVEPANLADLGGDGKVVVFPSSTGGKPMEFALRGAEGREAAATRNERNRLAPFVIKTKKFVTAGDDAVSQAELGVLKVNVKDNDPKWQPFPADEEIRIQRISGARYAGYVEKSSVLSRLRSMRLKRLSPVRIDEFDVLPEGGVYATGAILPETPLLSGLDLGFELVGDDLSVYKEFRAEDFRVPAPFEVRGSTLVLSISTERGFSVEGQVDFAIERVGEGYLRAAANARDGLSLQGSFTFDTDLFEQATIDLWYRDDAFGARGTLAIGAGKVRGIRSGRATVEYSNDALSAEGEVTPDIPGISEGRVTLSFSETEGLVIGGGLTLASNIPGIRGGSIDVTARKTEEGWKVSASGSAEPNIPGVDATLQVSYDDGLFTIQGSAAYERGMLRGRVEVGVTNRPVDESGRPSGEPGRDLRAFGGGTVTVRFSPWLQGTVGVRLLENGEIEVSGEIGFPQAIELFPEYPFEKDLLRPPPLDIPIVGVAAAGRRIGIFATVRGGLQAKAGIGPGVLEDVALGVTYNPDHEDQTRVTGTARLNVPAFAELRLYVRGGIGAGIPIVSATAGLEVGGQLGLHGALNVGVDVEWTPAQGLVIDAVGEIFVQPKFVFDISAFVDVELDLLLKTITLYEGRWELASVEFGSNMRFGVRFPVHYEEGKPFDISLSDIEFIAPDIDVKELISGLVDRVV